MSLGTVTVLVLGVANRREGYRPGSIDAMRRDARQWLADQDSKEAEAAPEDAEQ